MAAYYTTKLTWLSGNKLESGRLSFDEAMDEYRRLKRHPAVKKVVLNRYRIEIDPIKVWKRSGINKK